jgi:hypothetical protein
MRAVAAPMPCAPPVITNDIPDRPKIAESSLGQGRRGASPRSGEGVQRHLRRPPGSQFYAYNNKELAVRMVAAEAQRRREA